MAVFYKTSIDWFVRLFGSFRKVVGCSVSQRTRSKNSVYRTLILKWQGIGLLYDGFVACSSSYVLHKHASQRRVAVVLLIQYIIHCRDPRVTRVLEPELKFQAPGIWIFGSVSNIYKFLDPAPEWFCPNWKPLYYLYNLLAPQTRAVEREPEFQAPAPLSKIFWLQLQPCRTAWAVAPQPCL